MEPWLDTASTIAEEAGDIIRDAWSEARTIAYKGEVDLVTDTDRAVEALVVERLRAEFPDHRILAEETARPEEFERLREDTPVWVVDPLDGTTNFAHGYPHVAVSIGLCRRGAAELGVVHDPMRRETFRAIAGSGATLNGSPIQVSGVNRLETALVGTGFPYDRRQHSSAYLRFVEDVMLRAQGIRRAGTAALDLCWVACGRLDAFWEFKLKPWDMAGGAAVVVAAGGRVTDFDGDTLDLAGKRILASNGAVHEELGEILTERLAREAELQ